MFSPSFANVYSFELAVADDELCETVAEIITGERLSAECSRSTRLVSHSVEPYANTQNHEIHGAIISEHFMMITKFNKRKCLFKEIVKISELCFGKKQTWQA